MEIMYLDERLRKRIVKNNNKIISKFSYEDFITNWDELLTKL
jgi:hypothetical protein